MVLSLPLLNEVPAEAQLTPELQTWNPQTTMVAVYPLLIRSPASCQVVQRQILGSLCAQLLHLLNLFGRLIYGTSLCIVVP